MKEIFKEFRWFLFSSGPWPKIAFFAWLSVIVFGLWIILTHKKPTSANIEAAIKAKENKINTYNAQIDSIQKISSDSIITDVFGQYITRPNTK